MDLAEHNNKNINEIMTSVLNQHYFFKCIQKRRWPLKCRWLEHRQGIRAVVDWHVKSGSKMNLLTNLSFKTAAKEIRKTVKNDQNIYNTYTYGKYYEVARGFHASL